MKKQLLLTLFVAASLFSFNSDAQTLVHYWNFNNITAPDSLPTNVVHASYSRIDTIAAHVWYTSLPGTSAAYISYYDAYIGVDSAAGVTASYNARFGDCACSGLRTRNPSDSMQLLAYMPTTHYQNPVIKFATERSNSGMHGQVYDYSTDNGATWSSAGLTIAGVTGNVDSPISITWMSVTVNLNSTADVAIRNNPSFIFRTRFITNTSLSSGNNRFENLTMEADTFLSPTIIEPVAIEAPVYTFYPNPVVNSLELNADIDGVKSIIVHGVDGKTVYAGLQSGKHVSINVADLSAGTYFVTIHEASTGTTSTVKFIKQ